MGARADHDAAAAGAVALAHAVEAVDDAARSGSRAPGRCSISSSIVDLRVARAARGRRRSISVRLCGGMLVAMPTAMPERAVDQQVRQPRRQDRRLHLLAVVVRDEVDRLLVDVGEQLAGDLLQAALGVPVGRRRVAVDRAEVALPVDQRVAQREVLGHAHQRVVDRAVAVRVVLAEHVADDARALHVRPVPGDVRLVHREQDAAVDGLEAVADVRQRPAHDHAHRVIEVASGASRLRG